MHARGCGWCDRQGWQTVEVCVQRLPLSLWSFGGSHDEHERGGNPCARSAPQGAITIHAGVECSGQAGKVKSWMFSAAGRAHLRGLSIDFLLQNPEFESGQTLMRRARLLTRRNEGGTQCSPEAACQFATSAG